MTWIKMWWNFWNDNQSKQIKYRTFFLRGGGGLSNKMNNLWSNIWWIDMISDYSKPQLQTNHKLNVFLSRLFKIIFRWCLIGFSIVLLYKKHSDSTWHYSSRISNNHAHNSFCDIDCGPYGEFHFLNILSVFAKLFIPFKNIWFHFFIPRKNIEPSPIFAQILSF